MKTFLMLVLLTLGPGCTNPVKQESKEQANNGAGILYTADLSDARQNDAWDDISEDPTNGDYELHPSGIACRNSDSDTVKKRWRGYEKLMAISDGFLRFDRLFAAIRYRQENLLRFQNIDRRRYNDKYGLTLPALACKLSDAGFASILSAHGTDTTGYQSPYRRYPVYPVTKAVFKKAAGLIRSLLAYHAQPDVKDKSGNTPFSPVRETGPRKIETLLPVENGERNRQKAHIANCPGHNTTDGIYNGKTPVQQEGQQQDPALCFIRQFYVEYITELIRKGGPDNEKTEAIQRQYISPELLDRLQRMYEEMDLDYDPFLKAQDSDKSVLEKLRIEKDTAQTNVYRVYIWDNFNKKYKEIKLLLKPGEQGYKIDNILSLPND